MHLDLAKALGLTGFTLSTVIVVAILLLPVLDRKSVV